jgi:hypothetical protein
VYSRKSKFTAIAAGALGCVSLWVLEVERECSIAKNALENAAFIVVMNANGAMILFVPIAILSTAGNATKEFKFVKLNPITNAQSAKLQSAKIVARGVPLATNGFAKSVVWETIANVAGLLCARNVKLKMMIK